MARPTPARDLATFGRRPRGTRAARRLPVASMLVVDDEPTVRFAMREYFVSHGFEVAVADDTGEAVMLLASRSFELLIADLRMRGSDSEVGLTVIAHARRISPETRIIILTAYGTPELKRRAEAQGVSAFLQKPTPLAELAQVVFAVLADRAPRSSR